jgi:hypothetical protein
MGLPFNLPLSANTKFLRVGEIPTLTAKAIHPESDNDSEAQGFARAGCQINHEEALGKAIKAGMVTPLNPLSYEQHTFPFGDALRSAIISLDDFKRFAASLQIEVVIWDEPDPTQDTDDVAGTKTHLTIDEAASALTEKYGFSESSKKLIQAQLFEAAKRGEIAVRCRETLLPYTPRVRRDFFEVVSVSDFNAWLKTQGVKYQLDSPEQVLHGDDAPEQERDKNTVEIPGKLPLREAGKLAIKAAWQIECETKRRASAKEVMTRLQAWADAGEESAILIKSLPSKRAVQWLTTKGEYREYTLEACGKTLETWHKSRQ